MSAILWEIIFLLYFCLLYYFSEHKTAMKRLKKLLPDSTKRRRCRQNVLNIQIAILGWLVELLGFLVSALGVFILGHENPIITMTLQTFSMIFYAILVPCTLLINSSDFKDQIVESHWYLTLLKIVRCQPPEYSSNDVNESEQNNNQNLKGKRNEIKLRAA